MLHKIKHERSQGLIDFACKFATDAHGDQTRKYTGEPYINHPIAVAELVATVTDDCQMIAAAFLHDVVEDTPATYADIVSAGFGHEIARLVDDLTDVSKMEYGNRACRKAMDRRHTENACADAKTIKLADLINNAESICEHDKSFAKVFMLEMAALMPSLKEGDVKLFIQAQTIVSNYFGLTPVN